MNDNRKTKKKPSTLLTYLGEDYMTDNLKKSVRCVLQFKIDMKNRLLDGITADDIDRALNAASGFSCHNKMSIVDPQQQPIAVRAVTIAKATLSPQDKYNEELGKSIAQSRAQANAFAWAEEFFVQLANIHSERTNTMKAIARCESEAADTCVKKANELGDLPKNS